MCSQQRCLLASCHCTGTLARLPVDTRHALGDYEQELKDSKTGPGGRSNAVDKCAGDLLKNTTNVLLVIYVLDLQQMFSKKNQGQYHTFERQQDTIREQESVSRNTNRMLLYEI